MPGISILVETSQRSSLPWADACIEAARAKASTIPVETRGVDRLRVFIGCLLEGAEPRMWKRGTRVKIVPRHRNGVCDAKAGLGLGTPRPPVEPVGAQVLDQRIVRDSAAQESVVDRGDA